MLRTKDLNLTERDIAILKATIEEYIDCIHPVGSHYLKSACKFDCSSATIRNSMAKLETLGLLSHPFTSAGRIPTDAGYRYYVDEIIVDDIPDALEDIPAVEDLTRFADQIDRLLQATASVLSDSSKLFSIVLLSDVRKSVLTKLDLIELSSDRIMMIIEVDSGLIQSMVFNLQVSIEKNMLVKLSSFLGEMLNGLTLEDIRKTFENRVHQTEFYHHEIIQILLKNPRNYFSIEQDSHIFTSSMVHLLQYPEFNRIEMVRDIIHGCQIENIKSYFRDNPETTLIGMENTDEHFQELSILKQDFVSEHVHGQLAVIGPTRMPYKFAKRTLNKFAELLPHVI